MPKTVRELINEAKDALEDYQKLFCEEDIDLALAKLQKAIDAIDNGGSLETVVRE
jgi:hypothetical protein